MVDLIQNKSQSRVPGGTWHNESGAARLIIRLFGQLKLYSEANVYDLLTPTYSSIQYISQFVSSEPKNNKFAVSTQFCKFIQSPENV